VLARQIGVDDHSREGMSLGLPMDLFSLPMLRRVDAGSDMRPTRPQPSILR
jgi:hypothetical protein